MIKPKKHPRDFGFKQGDVNLVVNAQAGLMKCFSFQGRLMWVIPCLAMGMHPDWQVAQGDTPPGLYKLGAVYDDIALHGNQAAYSRELAAFGWVSFDMVDLEGNEDNNGRAGIMIHGGGSGLGWSGAWSETQPLLPTWGCIRVHNGDAKNVILPLTRQGAVFVSVYQVA